VASPVVQQVVEGANATATLSHTINLPTATAGLLLLIILGKGSSAASVNAHASLTELLDENQANGLYIAYRWMDGTEPASYTLAMTGTATRSAYMCYRISGAENPATQAPQIGTTSNASSATPDPPASATPGSSKDYLFITYFSKAGEEADDDTWSDVAPTNYTPQPPRMVACGVAGTSLGGMIAAAERALTTGVAENPGTFTVDASNAWRAQTIMVHPAAVVNADAEVSFVELEVPTPNAIGQVSWVEMETPTPNAMAQSSWIELEVPNVPAPDAGAEISWLELEVPVVDRDAEVAWLEMEFPTPNAEADIAWLEVQFPNPDAGAQVSHIEVEVPSLGGVEYRHYSFGKFFGRAH